MKLIKRTALAAVTVCILVLCTVLCASGISAAETKVSGHCGDDVIWTLYDDGKLVLEGTGPMWSWDESNPAPWTLFRREIASAVLSEGITTIGSYAFFECRGLVSVNIPDGVTTIGEAAFHSCTNLMSIQIPNSVTTIGKLSFHSCTGLTKLRIPESVTTIGISAFSSCTNLANVMIPKNVTSIGSAAFYRCSANLRFTVDENNKSYSTDEAGVLFDKEKKLLIQYPAGSKETTYTVPEGVTSIGYSAFSCVSGLTSVTVPSSVTSIADYAFIQCTELTSVTVLSRNAEFGSLVFGTPSARITVYGYEGSTAEEYARKNGYKFAPLAESGDINSDDSVDISDALLLFMHSMLPEEYPLN